MTSEERLYENINGLVEQYLTEKLRRNEPINVPDMFALTQPETAESRRALVAAGRAQCEAP